MVYLIALVIILITFVLIYRNFIDLRNHNEGTDDMVELAGIIRRGAKTFLKREYRVIIPTVLIVAVLYSLFREAWSGLTFVFGATLSIAAVEIGMRGGTYANVRTTNAARVTGAMSRTMRIALLGGSLSGYSVPAFGLLGFLAVWVLSGGAHASHVGHGILTATPCNVVTMRLTTYSLGCSVVAMFNRVAGGNYTKAADISADIVGKNIHNMPEDDSRMPNSLADFIGDCVNDIAGNISDLLESFVATPTACILIAMQVFKDNDAALTAACLLPFILSAGGLLSSIIGVNVIIFKNRKRKSYVEIDGVKTVTEVSRETRDPGEELNRATYLSAAFVIVVALYGSHAIFGKLSGLEGIFKIGWISPFVAAVLGMISSVAVGKITEYYTSMKFKPVKRLAQMATEGDAFVVTFGDAIGSRSVLLPVLVIGISMLLSGWLCGTYGIAIAALGMLSFVGTTVSIDAFGPIADNAGGIAESCHLDESVREITDQLDAVGNTTAAIGKGNAIGSAAFATVALIMSYIGSYPASDFTNPITIIFIIVGGIIGGALIEYFVAILTENTINSAKLMADEGERQLREEPGILEGKVKPDYDRVIKMAADEALRCMLLPSILALISPIIFGFPFGPEIVLGLLGGSTITAISRAIFNGNSGGAFDNAKKLIETGGLPGFEKGSAAHKAAVVGDTIGDTRKDVVGVALDIFIKTMSTVANTLAPVFYAYRLF
ncbi:sodium-translocating pyrophosphatase [Candidatus Saccharibacteria bacterium]|nr:sodium-translocating pyrophosphatase [Candidatus Saccharibacteria bacterium]